MTYRILLAGRFFLTACTILAVVSCGENTAPTQTSAGEDLAAAANTAAASNSWTSLRALPEGRAGHVAGVVNNSAGQPIVYVVGGYAPGGFDEPDQTATKIFAYNYSTNSWQTKRARLARLASNGVGVIGGKLYLSGGINLTTRQPSAGLIAYDPAQDAFTAKAPMPNRSTSGVTGVIGSRLYVLTGVGGDCACTITNRFHRYNPGTDTWTSLAAPPSAHAHGAAGVINGKLYVAGGVDGNGPSNKLHVYDPATNQWQALAPLPSPVYDVAGAVVGNKLHVVGNDLFAYDPATNRWTVKAPPQQRRYELSAVSVATPAGARLVAMGGRVNDFPSRENEAYAP